MGLSSQILPVVGVNTSFFVMVVAPGAPCCLKIKHIKVLVFRLDFMKEINGDLVFRVGKSTHLAVLTILHVFWVGLTKLGLVFFWMVEFLNTVVCFEATLTVGYALIMSSTVGNFGTHFTRVGAELSTTILFEVMEMEASFWIVLGH